MYNGIGLTTARGSGTSGYVQKSLAFVKPKHVVHNYKEVLEKFKENPAPTKRKANSEIIEHEVKHKIEVKIFEYMDELKEKGVDDAETERLASKKREDLYKELEMKKEKGLDLESFGQDTHHQSKLKDLQMEKIKEALGVRQDYEHGTAFDIELQEEIRKKKLLEKKEEKRQMKKELKRAMKEEQKMLKKAEKEMKKLQEQKIEKIVEDKEIKPKDNAQEFVVEESRQNKKEEGYNRDKDKIDKERSRKTHEKYEDKAKRDRKEKSKSRSRSRNRDRDWKYKDKHKRRDFKSQKEEGEVEDSRYNKRTEKRSFKEEENREKAKSKRSSSNEKKRTNRSKHRRRSPSSSSDSKSSIEESKSRSKSSSSSSDSSDSSSSFYN